MNRYLLITAAAVFCLLCAAAAGCISPNMLDPLPTPTQSPAAPGEWEGVLLHSDGTQVEYKIDCEYGGAATMEIDPRMGVKDIVRTYHGTWTENTKDSYTLSLGTAGTYLLVINKDGSGTMTTPDGITVPMYPDDTSDSGYDSAVGEWKGTVASGDTRVAYDVKFDQSGSVEIESDTVSPLSYDKDVTSYGTWTKSSFNVYSIAVPGTSGYTLTLSSNSEAILTTPDNSNVTLVRDY